MASNRKTVSAACSQHSFQKEIVIPWSVLSQMKMISRTSKKWKWINFALSFLNK